VHKCNFLRSGFLSRDFISQNPDNARKYTNTIEYNNEPIVVKTFFPISIYALAQAVSLQFTVNLLLDREKIMLFEFLSIISVGLVGCVSSRLKL